MFRAFFRHVMKDLAHSRTTRRATRPTHRPRLAAFEERVLLSTFHWGADVSGSWNASNNWLDQNGNHGIPGAADDAIINPYGGGITVSIPSSVSVHSLQCEDTLQLNGGTLSVANNSNVSAEFDMAAGTALNIAADAVFSALGNNSTQSGLAGTINVGTNASLTTYGVALSGTVNAAAGSNVYLDGLTNVNAGSVLAGTGLYDLASNGSTLMLNVSAAPQAFMINADDATIQGPGNLSVGTAGSAGTFIFAGGTLEGSGTLTVPAGAAFTVSSHSGHNLAMNLDNHGMFKMPEGDYLGIGDTTTFINEGDGVINLSHSGDQINPWATPGLLENYGRINVSTETGVGSVTVYCAVDNQGSIDLQDASTLSLGGPVSSTNGIFQADNAAGTLDLTYGGTSKLNSGTHFQGAGFTHYAGGDNGVLNITGPVSVIHFQQDSGDIVGDSNALGSLAISGVYNWNKQELGSSAALPVTIAGGAVLNVGSVNQVTLGSVLNNQGTVDWSGTGNFAIGSTGDIENHGQFHITGDALLTDPNNFGWLDGVFNNYGTVTKTSPTGAGTTLFRAPAFNNYGTVAVQSGTLALGSGGVGNSLFEIAGGAELAFNYHLYTLNGGSKFTGLGTAGTGRVDIGGGTLDANAAVSIPTLELDSGILTGPGLTVTKSLVWTGGTINTSGSPVSQVKSHGTIISGNATKLLDGATLTLSGKTTWSGSGNFNVYNGGIINNGSTFTITNDQSLAVGWPNSGIFNNMGTLSKTQGMATTEIGLTFNNSGEVQVSAAGLDFSGSLGQASGSTLTGGTWLVASTTKSALESTLSFSGSSNLTTIGQAATVTLSGPKSQFTNLSALATSAGKLSLLAGASFQTAGAFSNQGVLTLAPVSSGSTLSVAGNFSNSSSAMLTIDLAGTSAAPTYGTIKVSGNVTLSGTLALAGTVKPAVGVPMTIIQASGSIGGSFAAMSITYGGMTFSISVSGNDLVLTRTA